eukprot:14064-Heterococcus_DN1.PRE.3
MQLIATLPAAPTSLTASGNNTTPAATTKLEVYDCKKSRNLEQLQNVPTDVCECAHVAALIDALGINSAVMVAAALCHSSSIAAHVKDVGSRHPAVHGTDNVGCHLPTPITSADAFTLLDTAQSGCASVDTATAASCVNRRGLTRVTALTARNTESTAADTQRSRRASAVINGVFAAQRSVRNAVHMHEALQARACNHCGACYCCEHMQDWIDTTASTAATAELANAHLPALAGCTQQQRTHHVSTAAHELTETSHCVVTNVAEVSIYCNSVPAEFDAVTTPLPLKLFTSRSDTGVRRLCRIRPSSNVVEMMPR